VAALAPSVTVRNSGSSAWMLSDEASMNRLTRPSAPTVRGRRAALSCIRLIGWAQYAGTARACGPFSAGMATIPRKLIHVDDSEPGITRKKTGRRWAYFDADGERITDRDAIDRLNRIALPPAYTKAWFCPDPNGHI